MKNSTANDHEIYKKPLIKENIKKENFDELGFYEDRIKNTEDTDKFIAQQKSKKIRIIHIFHKVIFVEKCLWKYNI